MHRGQKMYFQKSTTSIEMLFHGSCTCFRAKMGLNVNIKNTWGNDASNKIFCGIFGHYIHKNIGTKKFEQFYNHT